jgi:hypothetical protein
MIYIGSLWWSLCIRRIIIQEQVIIIKFRLPPGSQIIFGGHSFVSII